MQAWRKLLLGVSICSFLAGIYVANGAKANGTVGDYFRNIGYREMTPLPWEELGFSTGNIPIFDGYNHDKHTVGELAYAEMADVLKVRNNSREWWYYVVSEDGENGWIAHDSDFHLMTKDYLDGNIGENNPHRSSYFELLIKLGKVDEKFLTDIIRQDYNVTTRDAALQALSKMAISPGTEYEVLKLGKRLYNGLYENGPCFVFTPGGTTMFNILSRSDDEEAFRFMVDAFLRELDLHRCWVVTDDQSTILMDAAKTPEQVSYLKGRLISEITRYKQDYAHFKTKYGTTDIRIEANEKTLNEILNQTMPR